jgi:hypothetical protein
MGRILVEKDAEGPSKAARCTPGGGGWADQVRMLGLAVGCDRGGDRCAGFDDGMGDARR